MERALKLVATGTLTIAMAQVPRGKPIAIPRTFNRTNGKKSTRPTSFSDIAWQKASRAYAKSARALSEAKFDDIVLDALTFVKPTRAPERTADTKETTNERADDPDSGKECMSRFLFRPVPHPDLRILSESARHHCIYILILIHVLYLFPYNTRFSSGLGPV